MFEIVKDKIMYHASARNYKVGDVLEFGKERNYQAVRAYEQGFRMPDGENYEIFVGDKLTNKKRLTLKETKDFLEAFYKYSYAVREYAMEECRKRYFPDHPSRFSSLFLVDNLDSAKGYLSTAKGKLKQVEPRVIVFKLNGKLLKTSNAFNDRGLSFDDTVENAKKYFKGVDDSFENKKSIEYLFEGKAEVVEIITQ